MDYVHFNEVKKMHQVKKHRFLSALFAFLSGGILGLLSEGMKELALHVFHFSFIDASFFASMILVILASSFTFLGIYNNISQKCGAGLFLPTTGFANSLTSAAMEGRSEGIIGGIGSMMFSLAGSVISVGFFMAFYFGTIYALLNLWGINLWL